MHISPNGPNVVYPILVEFTICSGINGVWIVSYIFHDIYIVPNFNPACTLLFCFIVEINEDRCTGIRERKPRIEIIGPTFNYATGEIVPGEIIIHNTTDTFDPAVEIAGGTNRLYSDSAGNITIF